MMDAIYKSFYGLLLHPIQVGLGLKKIIGNKISKCYQQSVELAKLVDKELEKKLFEEFLETKKDDFHHPAPLPHDGIRSTKYYIYVATEFEDWKYTKIKSTTDILFRASLQYVRMMILFMALKHTIRCGDAISIENVYNDFLPFFEAAGKSNYVEIVLNQTDQ